jgi:hypothetical protein
MRISTIWLGAAIFLAATGLAPGQEKKPNPKSIVGQAPRNPKAVVEKKPAIVLSNPAANNAPELPPGGLPPAGSEEPRRALRPDGTAIIAYSDGTVITASKGGVTVHLPNGYNMSRLASQIPAKLPADLPGKNPVRLWVEWHSDAVLGIISNLLGDEAMVDAFVKGEASMNVWEKLQHRTDSLANLLTKR